MRIMHISDLHLGKRLNERSLDEDQRYILKEILRIADDNKADALIVAGDIYDDGNSTSADSVSMFDDFITELSRRNLPTYIISGNHDSATKLEFGSRLFNDKGLFISKSFSGSMERHELSKNGQTIDVYLLPFVKPSNVKKEYPEESVDTYEDAVSCVIKHTEMPEGRKRILVTHQYVVGSSPTILCESERFVKGGTEQIKSRVFDGFDYVALGHIHTPQDVGCSTVRYCGSPLKYSKSEIYMNKSVTMVDIDDDVKVWTVPLVPLRDMRLVKGTLDQIIDAAKNETEGRDDYIYAELEDHPLSPMDRLREVYPNIMHVDFAKTGDISVDEYAFPEGETLDPMAEFEKFFHKYSGEEMTDSQKKIVRELFEETGVMQ